MAPEMRPKLGLVTLVIGPLKNCGELNSRCAARQQNEDVESFVDGQRVKLLVHGASGWPAVSRKSRGSSR